MKTRDLGRLSQCQHQLTHKHLHTLKYYMKFQISTCAHQFYHWFEQLWMQHNPAIKNDSNAIMINLSQSAFIYTAQLSKRLKLSHCPSISNTQRNQSWQPTRVGNSHDPSVPSLGSQKVEAETYLICESIKIVRTFSPYPYFFEAISVC